MAAGPQGLAPQAGLVEAAVISRLPDHVTLHQHIFTPLIDSASIGPDHWNAILDVIDAHPDCAVLLIHGTDTLSFTGAALSQALNGLGRRVVLCASMVPLGAGGDAEGNLEFALEALINGGPAGVFLSFAGQILPACGLVKHHCSDVDAFRAIPQDPLPVPQVRRFSSKKIAIVTLAAGLPAAALTAMFAQLDGVVLRVFGAGTIMSDADLLAVLSGAVQRGVVIRAVSQCEVGHLQPGAYAAGAPLWTCGVQSGGRETPEAALAHLWLNT